MNLEWFNNMLIAQQATPGGDIMQTISTWLSTPMHWVYLIGGLVMTVALLRILFRGKQSAGSTPAKTEEALKPASVTETEPVAATSRGTSEQPVPSVVSRMKHDVSWQDRQLFAKTNKRLIDQDNPVPELLPQDAPTASNSDYTFGAVTPTLAEMLPESEARSVKMKQDLKRAGYYQPHAWQNLSAIRYLAIIIPLLVFGILLLFLPANLEWIAAVLLIVVPVLGWAIPGIILRSRAEDRVTEIENGMPDMLDMMNMCVDQGLTVKASLFRVSQDLAPVYPALAEELHIVHEQAEIGTLRHALENFAERIDIPSVQSFCSLLIQTEEMGTNVADSLEEHSDTLRDSLRQRADEKANSAAFKLLFPTVLCLMPAVFMILLGPAIIELSEFFTTGGFDLIQSGQNAIQNLQ